MNKLRRTAVLAAAALSVLAVPATTTAVSGTEPSGSTADYDPEGVLRVALFGMDRMPMKIDEDNIIPFGIQPGVLQSIFGTPLRLAPDGSYEPMLAESYEVVDDVTATLVLRPGLTFQDGEPYTAQSLADTMLANQARSTAAQMFGSTILADIESIEVLSDTEMTFHLSAPKAGLLAGTLAGPAAYAVSSGSNPPETIYGAGPFQVVDFAFNDRLVVEKWDDYFDADEYLLGGAEYLSIGAIEAAQNALEAGQVDLIATNPRDADALVARGPFAKVVTQNQGHYILAICADAPPFDDPKFREAFDLAIDRAQLNDVVLGGNAEPMQSLWNPGSPYAVEGLIDPDGDRDRARDLLEEIGYDEDTVIPFGVVPGFQTHELMAETIIGQVSEVGINMEIEIEENYETTRYINPERGGVHFVANVFPGVEAVTVPNTGTSSMWNPCMVDDPDVTALTDKLVAGNLTEEETAATWAEIQELVTSRHLWYPLVTQPTVYVYNTDRVQGIQPGTPTLQGATAVAVYYEGVSIKND